MDIDQLKTFLVVAKAKSFTHAANELYISQSSVSKRIKILEQEIGSDLFIRVDNKHIKLSPDGELFLPFVQHALESLYSGLSEIKENSLAGEESIREIRIGATSGLSTNFVPDLLFRFRKENRDREIKLYTYRGLAIIDMLLNEELDLGILSNRKPQNKNINSITLFQDEYTLVIQKKLLAQEQSFTLNDLLKYPVIRYNTGTFWRPINELFEKYNIPLVYSSLQSDSTLTIIQLVKNGEGYSFLPNYLVKQESSKELYIANEIEHITLPSRTVDLVFLKKNTRLARSFLMTSQSTI